MERERSIDHILWVMTVINLAVILYYCLICTATTYRLCGSFSAYDFLSSVRQLPQYPWRMPLWSPSLYLVLCIVGPGKTKLQVDGLWQRLIILP